MYKIGVICTVRLCRLMVKYIVGSEAYGFAYVMEIEALYPRKTRIKQSDNF